MSAPPTDLYQQQQVGQRTWQEVLSEVYLTDKNPERQSTTWMSRHYRDFHQESFA